VTGVLLVGGSSSRFGSNKALAQFRGERLAERGWRVLGEAFEHRVAVGKAADALALSFPLLDDGSAVRHPAAGIVAALRATETDVCVVLPVDCPLVTATALRELAAACADAAVPAEGGPLPGAFARASLPALERCLADEGSLRRALDPLDVRRVPLDPALLADADTPAALAALAAPGFAHLSTPHPPKG
jgi:molybdopterin-guanine dinucleotide biosynthesis protein A